MSDERLTDHQLAQLETNCRERLDENDRRTLDVITELRELRSARAASAEGGDKDLRARLLSEVQAFVMDGEGHPKSEAVSIVYRVHAILSGTREHKCSSFCDSTTDYHRYAPFEFPPPPTPPPAPRFTREVLQMFVNHDCSKFYAHDLAAHTERRDLARALLATEDELNRVINKGCDRIAALEAQLAESQQLEHEVQNRLLTMADEVEQQLAAHRADKGRIDQYAVGRVDQLTAEITALTKRNARLVSDMTSNHIQYHGQTCPCLTRLEAEKESSK